MMRALVLAFFMLVTVPSWSNDDTDFLDQAMQEENDAVDQGSNGNRLAPAETFRRTQLIFEHFKVPDEKNYQPELNGVSYTTEPDYLPKLLKFLDPTNQFGRFFTKDARFISSFADRDGLEVPEYRIDGQLSLEPDRRKSLRGMRIALDPGHMGGDVWDSRTGKYVAQGKTKVSEGVIALQTALLMEARLRALGAEVLITRRSLAPVTTLAYDKLDVRDYGRRELRLRSLEDWFQSLLGANSEGALPGAFEKSGGVKKAFSENARSDYFAMREDLFARDRKIKEFRPDLTIVIHFDADKASPNPKVTNRTRAYVAGAFGKTEFATGESRANFLKHLAKGRQYRRSVVLSEAIVGEIASKLSVPVPSSDVQGSLRVAPGVFARNLALTRIVSDAPLTFLECLYYGNPAEFSRLARSDGGTLQIDGRPMAYSSRLRDLADAITSGVVKYAASTRKGRE